MHHSATFWPTSTSCFVCNINNINKYNKLKYLKYEYKNFHQNLWESIRNFLQTDKRILRQKLE